jgi:four helix bundle protein
MSAITDFPTTISHMEDPPGLAEWAAAHVPESVREDSIWRLPAYRFALYLGDLVQREDAALIQRDFRTRRHLDQLLHAVGSISANISEGYGSTSGPERAKFYEYAQRSAREARDWLFKVRHALRAEVVASRIALVTRIMKILTVAITRERAEPETRALL